MTMKKILNTLTCKNGMTLIEILVAMAVGSIVMLGLYSMFNTQSKLYEGENKVMRMNSQAKIAMDFLSRRLRHLGYNPREISGTTFGLQSYTTSATNVTIYFTTDTYLANINNPARGDYGTLDNNNEERVYMQWDGSNGADGNPVNEIQLGIIDGAGARTGWQTIATDITSLAFLFTFDNGTTGTPTAGSGTQGFDDIRAVSVTMQAKMESAHNLTGATAPIALLTSFIKLSNITDD